MPPRPKRQRSRFGKTTRAKIYGGNVEFRVESKDKVDWKSVIDTKEARLKDFTPVFKPFAAYMLSSFQRTHAAQGRPKKWPKLADSTVKKRGSSTPILEVSGAMLRGYRVDVGKRSWGARNLKRYYLYHHAGTKKMPKRIVIQLLSQDKAQFTRLKNKHLRGD